VAFGRRLTQLHALVDRLERLAASPRREWMLQEARARMVDVETGDEPRPTRTLDEEPPARPLGPPGSGVGNRRAAKRPSSNLVSAEIPLRRAQPKVSRQQAPRSVPARSRIAATDWSPTTFGTDELLWLEDPSGDTVAEAGDGSTSIAPWRRGLRG
jgi:hypothetical protein